MQFRTCLPQWARQAMEPSSSSPQPASSPSSSLGSCKLHPTLFPCVEAHTLTQILQTVSPRLRVFHSREWTISSVLLSWPRRLKTRKALMIFPRPRTSRVRRHNMWRSLKSAAILNTEVFHTNFVMRKMWMEVNE